MATSPPVDFRMSVDGYDVVIRFFPEGKAYTLTVESGGWLKPSSLATIGAFISAVVTDRW